VADLRELGGELLAFYGQHEHRKLMLATAQLDILDTHCGAEQLVLRGELAGAYEQVRGFEARAAELQELAGARERELDLLAYELEEIDAADPSQAELADLEAERERLRNVETLRSAAVEGVEAIAPETGTGITELLGGAARRLETAAAIDGQLAGFLERVQSLLYEAQDLGAELRDYGLGIDAPPGRLEEVEERLAVFARLQRKHGGTIADVLAHAEHCRRRQSELRNAEVALESVQTELGAARARLAQLASRLGERRRQAAPALAEAVRLRLAELAMPDAEFRIELAERPEGIGPRGADAVQLLIAPNAGVPAAPLRETASGGELSRVMLALLSVAHGGGDTRRPDEALLVFDEIDAGIGGHTARAVGEQLRELAQGRQVLCITHLPQVAALADRHFTIVKDNRSSPAHTTVTALDGDRVVAELVRMLGASEDDRAASQHARQLLKAA
jgi:DNA repair protein RecN (Recombination protein N)